MPRKTDARTGRSKGDAHHVRVYSWMIKLPVWHSLDGNAVKLYVELSSLYYGENNGEIYMSGREAARRLGVAENTARNALKELQSKGFIRPYVKGGFSRKQRHATQWILTEHPFNGRPASKDFVRWTKENTGSIIDADCLKNKNRYKPLPQGLMQTGADIEADFIQKTSLRP